MARGGAPRGVSGFVAPPRRAVGGRRRPRTYGKPKRKPVRTATAATSWAGWRLRWQLVPFGGLLGALVAGALIRGPFNAGLLLVIAAVAFCWLLGRTGKGERVVVRRVSWTDALPLVGLPVWLAVAALIGLKAAWVSVFVVAWGAWASWWWRKYEVRAVVGSGKLKLVWAERAVRQSPDTYLLGEIPVTDARGKTIGREATIVSATGQCTTSEMVALTERVASWFGADPVNVTIEATKDRKGDRARLVIFERNPLLGVQKWTGPDLVDGRMSLGPYADGTLTGYRFYQPGFGPWHDLIAGTTGAGKSGCINMLLAASRHGLVGGKPGCMVDWVCDPQMGQSLPEWVGQVDWFAKGATEGLAMLRAAKAVMLARNAFLANVEWTDEFKRKRKGKSSFDPTPEMPLLVVTVEEAHALFAAYPDAVELAADIGKMARKCGIKLRLVVQVPLLSELGGSSVLRDMVASGNIIVFRTASRISGQVAFSGALAVDPFKIPREVDGKATSGMGYSLGVDARTMTFRTWLVDDPYHWATSGQTWHLDAFSAGAAGPAYAGRYAEDFEPGVTVISVSDAAPLIPSQAVAPGASPSLGVTGRVTTRDVALAYLTNHPDRPHTAGDVMAHVLATPGDHGKTFRAVSGALKELADLGYATRSGEPSAYRYQWKAQP